MIQSIELKNFKSIKRKHFPLRKLNLLLGLNGMGKSSFIQSLLLLRQSHSGLFHRGELRLNGLPEGYVNIGTVKDAKYQYNEKEDISFFLQFRSSDVLEMNFNGISESDTLRMKGDFRNIVNKFPSSTDPEPLFGSEFQYLNANRIPPQSNHIKSYQNVVALKNIGNYGEYTAHFIETFYNDDIDFENLIHKDSVVKDEVLETEIINKTLINQINLWMGEISPNISIKTTSVSSDEMLLEYVYKQPNFGNTNRFKPENVGFGISYALHVVTALLASRPKELIIIENPESHIHPRGQAELGRLIALTAQNDVQLIIEMHSDHIINGIRVAIKQNPALKDDAIIFYFDKNITDAEQYSRVTNIEIDRNGELSEYPKNMLDEWATALIFSTNDTNIHE
jgi:predicted ATPase